MTDWPARLLDAVNEMTRSRRRWVHAEGWDAHDSAQRRTGHQGPMRWHSRGRVELEQRSMLDTLQADVDRDEDTSPKTGARGGSPGYESKTPGRYAPRELLESIRHETAVWIAHLGCDQRPDLADNLRALVGIAPNMVGDERWQPDLEQLVHEAEQWAAVLRRYCDLERIFQPRAACPDPDCGKVGKLTIWLDTDGRRAERAKCGACSRTWDSASVGLLLEHIRTTTSQHDDQGEELIDAAAAAHHLGITTGALRTWRKRNPELLPVVEGRGPNGTALFRVRDVVRLADTRSASVA